MKKPSYWIFLSILGALILALVAVPAGADAPEHTKIIWVADFTDSICGVDDVPFHLEGKYEYILWRDKNGEAYGDSYHYGGTTLTFTINGHTLTLRNNTQERWTWIIPWYETIAENSGARWIGTLPGYGTVVGTVGKQVYYETCEWVSEGVQECENDYYHWSGMVFDDWDAVCNYMLNGN